MRSLLVLAGALLVVVACGGKTRDANAPLSPAAQKVVISKEASPTCKKIGTVKGSGKDLDGKVSDEQASNAVREQAATMGGDTAKIVTETNNSEAGSGGTYFVIDKTADVLKCNP